MMGQATKFAASAIAMVLLQGACAQAQVGYPGGYGGYGWGGWEGTAQGDYARGLGNYAMGTGFYNEQSAEAASINTDTVTRWNQFVYESQRNANRIYKERRARQLAKTKQAGTQVAERLSENPTPDDIYRGDALNALLDEVNDPRAYGKAFDAAKAKVGGETIRDIPFAFASAAITMSIHQLAQGDPPKALQAPEFAADREAIQSLSKKIRDQIDADQEPDKATIEKLLAAIESAEAKVDAQLTKASRDRNDADRYLKALHGLVAMLETPAMESILAGAEKRTDATLGDLLGFMGAFNLRFGPADTARQKAAYDVVYPKLAALRDQIAPAIGTAKASASKGDEAGDFFSGMSYDDLKKKARGKTGERKQP